MKLLKSIILILVLSIALGNMKVSASSVPIGISPDTIGFEEFTAWIMLLFGVHGDQDNPSQDYIRDSDFLDYLAEEFRNTEAYANGYTLDYSLQEIYQSYLDNKYKLKIHRSIYESLSQAIKNVFNSMQVKQVAFQGVASEGQYTKTSITSQLDSIYGTNYHLLNDTTNSSYNTWNNYWNSVGAQNITSAYYEVIQQTQTQIRIELYLTEYGVLNIENNKISVTPGGDAYIQKFDIISFYNNPTFIQYGNGRALQFTTQSTLNELFRDDSVLGQVFIDAGIQTLIDADKNTLITSYTDSATADTIEVAIPSDVSRILTDVQDRLISVSQAITQAQATVVDSTDSNAVEQANIAVYNPSPKYQILASLVYL